MTRRRTHPLEQTQHFRIRRIIRNRKRQVPIPQDGSDADQTGATTGHDANILPRVLALLTLAVVLIVQTSHGTPQRLDTGGRSILSRGRRDWDGCRAREAAQDLVVGLGGSLTQIGPAGRIFGKAVFGRAFRAPHHARGDATCIEACVGTVTRVCRAEV